MDILSKDYLEGLPKQDFTFIDDDGNERTLTAYILSGCELGQLIDEYPFKLTVSNSQRPIRYTGKVENIKDDKNNMNPSIIHLTNAMLMGEDRFMPMALCTNEKMEDFKISDGNSTITLGHGYLNNNMIFPFELNDELKRFEGNHLSKLKTEDRIDAKQKIRTMKTMVLIFITKNEEEESYVFRRYNDNMDFTNKWISSNPKALNDKFFDGHVITPGTADECETRRKQLKHPINVTKNYKAPSQQLTNEPLKSTLKALQAIDETDKMLGDAGYAPKLGVDFFQEHFDSKWRYKQTHKKVVKIVNDYFKINKYGVQSTPWLCGLFRYVDSKYQILKMDDFLKAFAEFCENEMAEMTLDEFKKMKRKEDPKYKGAKLPAHVWEDLYGSYKHKNSEFSNLTRNTSHKLRSIYSYVEENFLSIESKKEAGFIKPKSRRTPNKAEKRKLYRGQGGKCFWTGLEMDIEAMDASHVVLPYCEGGDYFVMASSEWNDIQNNTHDMDFLKKQINTNKEVFTTERFEYWWDVIDSYCKKQITWDEGAVEKAKESLIK